MNCPFCGTEAKPGAIVCVGCQAEYRRAGFKTFAVILFVACIVLMFAAIQIEEYQKTHKISTFLEILYTLGLFGGFVGSVVFAFKKATAKLWYRRSRT